VIGKGEVGAITDEKPFGMHGDALAFQRFDFRHEAEWIEGDPVANHTGLVRPEDARRKQVEDILLAAGNHGTAGVVATLARMTTSAELVRQSTTLPSPSSPHWAPTIIVFDMIGAIGQKEKFGLGQGKTKARGKPSGRSETWLLIGEEATANWRRTTELGAK